MKCAHNQGRCSYDLCNLPVEQEKRRTVPSPDSARGKLMVQNEPTSSGSISILQPGMKAPDFSLNSTPDQIVSLTDFSGQPVVLIFYPADFSPVCGDELVLFNELLPEFRNHEAAVIGISVDGVWCHIAYAKDRHLHFPLLADFEPKGSVAKSYASYNYKAGVSERSLFVIDRAGIISWSYRSPMGVNPGADGVLRALELMEQKRGAA